MSAPIRETWNSPDPRWRVQLTDDGSRTLVNVETGIAFHSGCGAVSETCCVYLEHSGVADRIAQDKPSRVLEIGFGTGLGMLMTLDLVASVEANQPSHSKLEYIAIERDWLTAETTDSLQFEQNLNNAELVQNYLRWRRSVRQEESTTTNDQADQTTLAYAWQPTANFNFEMLNVDFSKATTALLDRGCTASFDAIYFDPFDPASNPDCWTIQVASVMRRLLTDGGRLVSYCVNRKVRDTFASAGFDVYRVAGPKGGKREVMIAMKTTDQNPGNPNLKRFPDQKST